MMIQLIEVIGIFFYWTWFIWPFMFVLSFGFAIVDTIKGKDIGIAPFIWASVAMLVILCGVLYPLLRI